MMIALLFYCWAREVRSSRAIERACVEDVACRVIAAHQRPDHATIARFVERHERALVDFPRFRGHLIAGPSGLPGRIGVHAVGR
jgi:hypothetical protein